MSRSLTTDGMIANWDDGDNPGAGTKDVNITSGGVGLNANFNQLKDYIKSAHNNDGSLKQDIVDGENLKTTVADGVTLQKSNNKLKIVDNSITATQLKTTTGSEAVTTATIRDGAVTSEKINDGAVITAKLGNAAITLAKMGADSVDASVITHDNNRTKICFTFTSSSEGSGAFFQHNGLTLNAMLGIPMTRAGSITSIQRRRSTVNGTTTGSSGSTEYLHGVKTFAKGDFIALRWQTSDTLPRGVILVKNGSDYITSGIGSGVDGEGAPPVIYTIEVEYDD